MVLRQGHKQTRLVVKNDDGALCGSYRCADVGNSHRNSDYHLTILQVPDFPQRSRHCVRRPDPKYEDIPEWEHH